MANCPNCGAPIQGRICEYCGTPDPSTFRMLHGKPVRISYEMEDGHRYTFELLVESIGMEHECSTQDIYSFGQDIPCLTFTRFAKTNVSIQGSIVPMEMEGGRQTMMLEEVPR